MDRSRYRYVAFKGGRILQAREMDKLQDITRGVDDTNVPVAFDLDALYKEGATLNTQAVITAGTRTVTLAPIDVSKPMLVFVRGRWEALKTAEVPASVTLAAHQSRLYLNWQLVKITFSEDGGTDTDPLLKDSLTGEAAAEMGELRMQVSATDDSSRNVVETEFEKNTTAIVLFSFTTAGSSLTQDAKDNVEAQALATTQTAGLVKTTTDTAAGVVVSTDDPRMTDARTPTDATVTDAKVRTPLQDGTATNADGTKRYDLTKDAGGINSSKVVHQAGKQLVGDLLELFRSEIATLDADLTSHEGAALGQGMTHPFPTAAQVGATPVAHQSLGLEQAHGLAAVKNAGGFTLTRDKAVAATPGDPGYAIKDQDGDLVGLTHDGDVFSKKANAYQANPKLEGTDTQEAIGGLLGTISAIARVLAAHVNKKDHSNPHGLTLTDLGYSEPDAPEIDLDPVYQKAKAYTDTQITALRNEINAKISATHVRNEGPWVIISVMGRCELACGVFCEPHGAHIGPPNGFSNMLIQGAASQVSPVYDEDDNANWMFYYDGSVIAKEWSQKKGEHRGAASLWAFAWRML